MAWARARLLAAALALVGCERAWSSAPAGAGSAVERIRTHVFTLADDDMRGRASGSPEYARAATYVENVLRGEGLGPLFGASYQQPFHIQRFDFGRDGWIAFEGPAGHHRFRTLEDAIFFHAGPAAEILGPREIVYVGLGIHEPDVGWDDYAGLDLEGKCALLVVDTPASMAPGLPEALLARYALPQGGGKDKVQAAAAHGAACVVGMLSPAAAPMFESLIHGPEALRQVQVAGVDQTELLGLPIAAALSNQAAEFVFTDQAGRAFPGGRPRGFAIHGTFRFGPAATAQRLETTNVGAWLPGSDPDVADQVIVLSAHLDGQGMQGRTVLNSANDNASSVAALLEASRRLAEARPRHSVAFLFTAAEEDGLLGAERFLDDPPFEQRRIVLNVNMEMVGKPRGDRRHRFRVWGRIDPDVERLARAAERAVPRVDFNYGFRREDDGSRPFRNADHVRFFLRGIPTLYFWGGSEDYHQASDDPERLNLPKVAAMAEILRAVVQARDEE